MKLTDSQLVMLSAAGNRTSGNILPLPRSVKLNKGAATLVLKSLLKHKLVAEKPADRESESWREARDGQRFGLIITDAGLKAIGIEELPERDAEVAPASSGTRPHKSAKATASKNRARPVRKGSKLSVLIELLSRKTGATIEEAAKATGWQLHSIRGAISGSIKRKLQLEVSSSVSDRGRVYRIAAAR